MAKGVNVEFECLSYSVKCGTIKTTDKAVLKHINGEFRASELTVIMGPSGSGKTSLLNILTGFTSTGVSGSIRINGSGKNFKTVRNQSAYIMQDQNLYSLLTVRESMDFAVKFKTGSRLNAAERRDKIETILKQLRLYDSLETFVKDLSGGQQKRLSIAIELVDDPKVLFLDEPTTGLDSLSATQCVKLLKNLAEEGKTIICTIHTPSARLFEKFDHLYVLAEGSCIYQGSSKNVVPFLTELDLICPESYNPADYLLEISNNDYGMHNPRLTDKIQNGLNDDFRLETKTRLTNNHQLIESQSSRHSASFAYQLYLLIWRNLILMRRDKSFMILRLLVSFLMAVFTGLLFFDIGNLATHVFDNFKYIYITSHFLTYTSYFSLMVRFPLDLPILRREHFNRWYSSGSYYLALPISDAPVLVSFALIYNIITHVMTGQLLEFQRIFLVIFICVWTSFTAQAFGLWVGSMFNLLNTMVCAALVMVVHITFAGVLVLQKDALPWMRWLFDMDFMKHANDGITQALFGLGRDKLECNQIYCHFQKPEVFLKMIGAPSDPMDAIYAFPLIFLAVHLVAFYNVNKRLRRAN